MIMQQWLWVLVGVIVGLVSSTPPVFANEQELEPNQPQFSDISGHWAEPLIDTLSAQEMVGGFPDGTFRPDEPVSRAQFAALLRQAFAFPSMRSAISFTDVPSDHWAAPAIRQAYTSGFISGYPDNRFNPEQPIARAQVLVSLASGLDYSPKSLVELSLSYYQDADQIPDYAQPSIAAATEQQLVVNYPVLTRLNPNRPATRAEVVAFMYQALYSQNRVPVIPSPYIVCTDNMLTTYQAGLREEDPEAIESLIACGSQATPVLLQGIQDADKTVNVGAIFVMGHMGMAQSDLANEFVPALITVLADPDTNETVRSVAAEALGEIGSTLSANTSATQLLLGDAVVALEATVNEIILSTPHWSIPDTNTRGPRECLGECLDITWNSPLFMSAAVALAKINGSDYVYYFLGGGKLQPAGSPLAGIVDDQLTNNPPALCELLPRLWFCEDEDAD